MILTYSLVGLALFCAVHLFADRLRFLDGTPRSRWLSAAGGISLAYVFLHFMPELAEGQSLVREGEGGVVALPFIEFELYGLALAGLLAYYGAERYMQTERGAGRVDSAHTQSEARHLAKDDHEHGSFWVHLGSFSIYNLLTGYLLVRRGEVEHGSGEGEEISILFQDAQVSLVTFAVALAIHFLVTDYGLREDFREGYMRIGRWVLCAAVIGGWGLGATIALPEIAVLALIALLGGGMILNVLKEELPAERQSRFAALLGGALGYAVLLAFTH